MPGRGACFFKSVDLCGRLQGSLKNQREMTPPEDYSKSPVADPKGMEIQELPNKAV